MFKKIVSNLSFSPAVAGQLTYYSKRLRAESLTRTLSLVFGIGLFALQFASIIAPPTSANASGPSDIMPGGFSGQSDMVDTCRTNTFIMVVYGYFGITCDNVANGHFENIPAQNSTWLSLGRTDHPGSTPLQIGANTFYIRPLSSVATSPTGRAIVGTSSWGHPFAILISCGNPVVPGIPSPPAVSTPPSLVLHKNTAPGYPAAGSNVAPGALLGFRMPYGNSGQSGALEAQIIDNMPAGTAFVSQSSTLATSFQSPSAGVPAMWTIHNLGGGAIDNADLVIKVKDTVADGTRICNQATIRALYVPTVTSEQVCFTVKVPSPSATPAVLTLHKTTLAGYPAANSSVPPGTLLGFRLPYNNTGGSGALEAQLIDNMPAGTAFVSQSNTSATSFQSPSAGVPAMWTFHNLAPATNDYAILIIKIKDTVADGTRICNQASLRGLYVPTVNSEQVCFTVKVSAPPPPPPPLPPPPPPTTTPPPPPTPTFPNITQTKFAYYVARKDANGGPLKADAPGQKAQAGDLIEYTLKVANTGTGAKANYQIVEDLSDVLEYADVINAADATQVSRSLVWPAITIPANTTVTKSFSVQIKNPVPVTPRSSSDPLSFDLKMDNIFGTAVTVPVEAPPAKQVEVATQSLPQTGAGLSVGIVGAFFALIVFFYMRNKQLQTEIQILRVDNRPGV